MTRGSVTQAALTAALAGALVACMPAVTTALPVSKPAPLEAALAAAVYQESNSYRRNHGAQNLQRHTALDHLAQQHAEFLRKNRGKFAIHGANVSHYGFESRALAARQFYRMGQVGENVATTPRHGPGTATKLVALWANSPNHEANLRNAWTHTGIGVVEDSDGMVFATQMFGSYRAPMQRDLVNSLRIH
jgi:uncharacterized protein YkwD